MEELTIPDLKQILRDHGVRGYSWKRKAELIEMVHATATAWAQPSDHPPPDSPTWEPMRHQHPKPPHPTRPPPPIPMLSKQEKKRLALEKHL